MGNSSSIKTGALHSQVVKVKKRTMSPLGPLKITPAFIPNTTAAKGSDQPKGSFLQPV